MQTRRDHRWWKERWVAAHYAYLRSPELLSAHMKHKNHSASSLARVVSYERLRNGGDKGCSRQMISALLQYGRVKSCEPDLAAAIERVLDVPDHLLFELRSKSRDARQTVKGQAA